MTLEFNIEDVIIRTYEHPADYDVVRFIWQHVGNGIHITPSDTMDEIQKYCERSPGLFFIAEFYKQVVGTVMGGFDGRRGLIYHLAVLPEYQHQGIGAKLLEKVETRLRELGCRKVYLFITPDTLDLIDYYNKYGYEKMTALPMTKYLLT
jgi:ribosomal protein S18 acetylase RimI-like enzyme